MVGRGLEGIGWEGKWSDGVWLIDSDAVLRALPTKNGMLDKRGGKEFVVIWGAGSHGQLRRTSIGLHPLLVLIYTAMTRRFRLG